VGALDGENLQGCNSEKRATRGKVVRERRRRLKRKRGGLERRKKQREEGEKRGRPGHPLQTNANKK